MEGISVSRFKDTCHSVFERVRKTREPILIARFGTPVAQIMPPPPSNKQSGAPRGERKEWLGGMAGTSRILGDIVAPASGASDWEAMAAKSRCAEGKAGRRPTE